MKYIMYTLSAMRDIISYNEHALLIGDPLNRIEKELSIIEEKETNYSKKDFQKFHMDILNLEIALLPTTNKTINKNS